MERYIISQIFNWIYNATWIYNKNNYTIKTINLRVSFVQFPQNWAKVKQERLANPILVKQLTPMARQMQQYYSAEQ